MTRRRIPRAPPIGDTRLDRSRRNITPSRSRGYMDASDVNAGQLLIALTFPEPRRRLRLEMPRDTSADDRANAMPVDSRLESDCSPDHQTNCHDMPDSFLRHDHATATVASLPSSRTNGGPCAIHTAAWNGSGPRYHQSHSSSSGVPQWRHRCAIPRPRQTVRYNWNNSAGRNRER